MSAGKHFEIIHNSYQVSRIENAWLAIMRAEIVQKFPVVAHKKFVRTNHIALTDMIYSCMDDLFAESEYTDCPNGIDDERFGSIEKFYYNKL